MDRYCQIGSPTPRQVSSTLDIRGIDFADPVDVVHANCEWAGGDNRRCDPATSDL